MAKDDYHVIVYQILAYLYQCLKAGKDVDPELLKPASMYFKINGQDINYRYWNYIIYHLYESGLVEGIILVKVDGLQYPYPADLSECAITPKGIEYLTDNSFITKAKEFLKDVNAIVPFELI